MAVSTQTEVMEGNEKTVFGWQELAVLVDQRHFDSLKVVNGKVGDHDFFPAGVQVTTAAVILTYRSEKHSRSLCSYCAHASTIVHEGPARKPTQVTVTTLDGRVFIFGHRT